MHPPDVNLNSVTPILTGHARGRARRKALKELREKYPEEYAALVNKLTSEA